MTDPATTDRTAPGAVPIGEDGRPMSEAPRDGTTMVQLHGGEAWWPTAWTWSAVQRGWRHQFTGQIWREDRLGPTGWRAYVAPPRKAPDPTAEGLRAVLKKHGINHWLNDATALAVLADAAALSRATEQGAGDAGR